MNIYRIGGSTHQSWIKEVESAQKVIRNYDALVIDHEDEWTGVDPTKLEGLKVCGVDFNDYYRNLVNVGYYHGWVA